MVRSLTPFRFACPDCRGPLIQVNPELYRCAVKGDEYRQIDGIWHFMPPDWEAKYGQFIQDYQSVRREEGRGSQEDAYYRALPFRDLTKRFSADWRIRMHSFEEFMRSIIVPVEERIAGGQQILDLGAGNGWLSYHLARRGHTVAAVDLQTNVMDGLGAWGHYDAYFTPVRADFDHLPFADGEVDLVIYNASLHYSTDYETSLREALRVLNRGGQVIILDSPIYYHQASGEQMVREREDHFRETFSFPSNSLATENFLTFERIEELGRRLSIRWRILQPFYGLGWALRPWKARLLRQREPAQFGLVIGQVQGT